MSDCRGFLVLTQSCDLVRRSGRCAAKFVTLAAVKQIDLALIAELAHIQDEVERNGQFISQRSRNRLDQFIDRVLDNNEDGLFFLREEQRWGVSENWCAFLPLTATLPLTLPPKHKPSYLCCLNARIVGINGVFQAKLGALTGNMFARVGTTDFSSAEKAKYDHTRDELMKKIVWTIPNREYAILKNSLDVDPPSGGVTLDAARERYGELCLNESRKSRTISRIQGVLSDLGIDPVVARKINSRLETDAELTKILG